MGDRFELELHCSYCHIRNEDVWFAPTSGSDTFKCIHCGQINFVCMDYTFTAKKIEEISYENVEDNFLETTNSNWSDEDVRKICQDRLNDLKKVVQ